MLPRKRENCFPFYSFWLERSCQQYKTTYPFHGNTLMGFLCIVVEIQNISHCCEQEESIKHLFNYTNQMHNIYSLHTFTVLLLLSIRLVHAHNMRQHRREYFRIWTHWGLPVKCSILLSGFNQILSRHIFLEVRSIKFHENPSSGSRTDTCTQRDGLHDPLWMPRFTWSWVCRL